MPKSPKLSKPTKTPDHILIPKHAKISEREKKELFKKYNISFKELPKIMVDDPAISNLKLNTGDIIKIKRNSRTAGTVVFYRGVTNV